MGLKSDTVSDVATFWEGVFVALRERRGVDTTEVESATYSNVPDGLLQLAEKLDSLPKTAEAEIVRHVHEKACESPNFGGLGLTSQQDLTEADYNEVLFLVEAWLESLNAQERISSGPSTSTTRGSEVKPMTLAQKIFAQHVVGGCESSGLQLGDVVRTNVDWILASELSWESMRRWHEEMGSPGIWRNDRFWLAGDHVVHPKVKTNPKIQAMIDSSNKAKNDFRMTEYQGMNYTIMHTEFVRERAEPGMLIVGGDSHTCSAGAVGCLSIGLGTADVMMSLALGETWFKCPESIRIEFVGQPAPGMTGKDVILHILKELKRNTVGAERIVEFVGEGTKHLSCDARFAICNMCTEFGAITGVFEPDAITQDYINRRKKKTYKKNSKYFKADPDAEYAGRYTIDLSKVEACVAKYPEPDNVVPVSSMAGDKLDGVFIGACTTTEEELVLASLVLKAGLKKGLPLARGKRHYVPGSLPIVEKLRELGVLDIYEQAGFTRGPPGCSYCVGLSAEKADAGETWLSSQNRNFKNRMGKGAFGHVTSAVVCAASAFDLTITNPAELIKEIDFEFFHNYQKRSADLLLVTYVEPGLGKQEASTSSPYNGAEVPDAKPIESITSKVVTLGDNIDTDAMAPGYTLTTCITDEEFGKYVLENTHPDFRNKVKNGQQVVVAGYGMGIGSSREVAVSALKGAGVKAVIAKKYAFIYGRNQPSLGLLGIVITDEEFHSLATDGADITIDVANRVVRCGGKEFPFKLSEIEYNLTANKGIAESFQKYGKGIWTQMTKEPEGRKSAGEVLRAAGEISPKRSEIEW